MAITSVSGVSSTPLFTGDNRMDQFKQTFDALGSALKSGDLDAAKKAFIELQKNTPAQNGDSSNPMDADMETLGKALQSGDLTAAQKAYSNIQSKMSQGRPAGAPGAQTQNKTEQNSGTSSSSSSTKTYDKMDLNKDGTVTALERLAYELENPDATTASDTDSSEENSIDTYV